MPHFCKHFENHFPRINKGQPSWLMVCEIKKKTLDDASHRMILMLSNEKKANVYSDTITEIVSG